MNGRSQPGVSRVTLLVVSERADLLGSLRAVLEAEGHRALAAESARAAFTLLDAEAAAVLIVEQRLCAVYGDALARRLRERDAAAQVVVAAADREEAPPRDLLRRLGLHGYHAMADGPERLLELAEEFLDLSRLEADTASGRRETVDPIPLLRELADWFSLLVRDKRLAFDADIPPGLPPLAAEAAKLRVVVQNLLSNAAKFT